MSNGVEAYKATLKFIRSLLGLAFLAWLAWLVVPKLGGFCHWLGGLDRWVLTTVIVAPIAAVVLVAGFAIYAVFFKGTSFVKGIVDSETAKMAVRGRTVRVEAKVDPAAGGDQGS